MGIGSFERLEVRLQWLIVAGGLAMLMMTPSMVRGQSGMSYTMFMAHQESAELQHRSRVTLTLRDVPIESALKQIAKQAGLALGWSRSSVPLNGTVSVTLRDVTVKDAFAAVLRGTGAAAMLSADGQTMVIVRTPTSDTRNATPGSVTGQITDSASGRGLPGATVSIQGTKLSAITNDNGQYVIRDVPPGEYVLAIKAFGYKPSTRKITVEDSGRVVVNVVLASTPTKLTEVVTTATGKQRKLELGNDITVIDAEKVVRTEPITTVTDLLEARVPGLTVQHTSGAPGDPARIRIGGLGSVLGNNDPIIIVDGIRLYSKQSDPTRMRNLATPNQYASGSSVSAPSALDQIDPNSIKTIEVFKGPSAATMYGPDAANGVIVITTKRGEPGPTRWNFSLDRGRSYIPGSYPNGYFALGHLRYTDEQAFCSLQTQSTCVADSVVQYQLLNDPARTILGTGGNTGLTATVSGGVNSLQYSLTASTLNETGVLKLPDAEVAHFREMTGHEPPGWMRNPLGNKRWSVTSSLSSQVSPELTVALTGGLTQQHQQRSSLESQLSNLMSTYIDPSGTIWYGGQYGFGFTEGNQIIQDFYQRATEDATNFIGNVSVNWQPTSWATGSATFGLNTINRQDGYLVPRGVILNYDSTGKYNRGDGNSIDKTINVQGAIQRALRGGFQFRTTLGANYHSLETRDLLTTSSNLPTGSETIGNSQLAVSENRSDDATFGWFIEPTISHKRLWFSPGIRFDGGNTYGSHVNLFTLPKLSFSWLASDEPFFPASLKQVFNTLRLRAAYGQAGRQPGPADRLRLYTQSGDQTVLGNLGNTNVKPERSTEFEGGFDADMVQSRVSIEFSVHNKLTRDALLSVPLPPSISLGNGSPRVIKNIGKVRNTWSEITLGLIPLQSEMTTWNVNLNMSKMDNKIVSLGAGVEPFNTIVGTGYYNRIAPGYPLFGLWSKPILGYADANQDGVISPSEIQYGDSLVYRGQQSPKYELGIQSTLSLLRNTLTINANLKYTDGQTTQQHYGAVFLRGAIDSTAPLGQQAAAIVGAGATGFIKTISTLRLNSLSVSYRIPDQIAQRFKARGLSLALQGTNLGLWSSYTGKDPDVNSVIHAEDYGTRDLGALPLPRDWQLRVNVAY
jgi:TonB-linked SusC/RagA family outer membrane protein